MTVLRLLVHVAAAAVGVVVALMSVLVYRSATPFGLVLAAAASVSTAWWLVRSSRPGCATSYVAGWLVLLGLVVAGRPEGDYVVTADLRGYALLGIGLVLVPFGLVGLAAARESSP